MPFVDRDTRIERVFPSNETLQVLTKERQFPMVGVGNVPLAAGGTIVLP